MLGAIDFTVEHPEYWSKLGESKELAFEKAMKFISYLRHKHKGLVSFDTETESLAKKYNRLVSIQLGINDKTGYVICLDSPYTEYSQSQIIKIKSALKELFEDENTHIVWIGHNAQYDACQVSSQLGVKYIAKPVIDTMLFIHLLDENRIQKFREDENGNKVRCSAALKSVCNEFFNFRLYDKEAIEARKNENLLLLPKDKFIIYAGMDAYVTFRLFLYLKLVAEKYDYYDKAKRLLVYLISPAIKMLSWVSGNGFCVDIKHLKYLLSNESPIMERINEIENIYKNTKECIEVNKELYTVQSKSISLFGMSTPWILDLNKPAHRVALFYTSKKGFKLTPVKDKKAKGKFSTGKPFQKVYSDKNKIVHLYEEEQGLKKLKSSYLNSIWKCMLDSTDARDGRVRANFVMNGTVTGRICSNNPNLQQIPRSDSPLKKSVKCLYRAEPSGDKDDPNVLLQADFCANEIRFWAAISGDPYLCNSFNKSYEKGQMFRENPTDEKLEEEAHLLGDIHKQTAAKMYDIPIKEVTGSLRQTAKSLSLGIMYQRGEKSVAQQLNITPEQAHEKFEIFFKNYGVGVAWSESMKKMVNKCGYVISPLGRMRRLGDLIIEGKKLIEKSKEFPRGSSEGKRLWIEGNRLIGRAERRSVNSPIQGLASDLALISLSLLHQYIIKNDLKWKIVNSVHDSVVIELRLSQVMKASKIIRKIFTRDSRKYAYKYFGWKMPTHIDIDFEIGQNKCWKCSKCGQLINYWKKSCDRKDKEGKVCGCTKLINHKLNSGYGTLVGWDETEAQLKEIQKGF